jgi:alpha-1,3-rhamnosyl/mannosyltransferase
VSEFSRQCIEETYRVAPERVVVAPVAVDPVFSPARRADAAALLAPVGVRGRYVVALGGARRRGLDVAVNAWRAVRGTAREPDLVVVGSEAPPADDGLIYAGPVDDRTWATLLAGAEAFCYPTRYEGFGLPALEAAASGVPVVCAPVASLPEILGDAAEWSSDTGPHAVALALRRVLTDDARRAELSAAGLARAAAGPRWTDIATRVTAAYAMAAGCA